MSVSGWARHQDYHAARFLSEPELRQQITAITNRVETFHGFAAWLMFGGKLIGHNDPVHEERVVKFNELVANCTIYSTALHITDDANALAAQGHPVDPDDLATITPYITRTIRRFGDWVLNLTPPEGEPITRLDLGPRAVPDRPCLTFGPATAADQRLRALNLDLMR
ncbi:Tn3 family transposase [Nocardia sp. NPDC051463]|uniref:Tn3 family transposase n=1 Tax=Nocardia sp. NPDC051463 TaxID=3154845 RepID=UPI003428A81C